MLLGFSLTLPTVGLVGFVHSHIVHDVNAWLMYAACGVGFCAYVFWKFEDKFGRGQYPLPVPEFAYLCGLVWTFDATAEFAADAGWVHPNMAPMIQILFGLAAGLALRPSSNTEDGARNRQGSRRKLPIGFVFACIGIACEIVLGWSRKYERVLLVQRYTACVVGAAAMSYEVGLFLG